MLNNINIYFLTCNSHHLYPHTQIVPGSIENSNFGVFDYSMSKDVISYLRNQHTIMLREALSSNFVIDGSYTSQLSCVASSVLLFSICICYDGATVVVVDYHNDHIEIDLCGYTMIGGPEKIFKVMYSTYDCDEVLRNIITGYLSNILSVNDINLDGV